MPERNRFPAILTPTPTGGFFDEAPRIGVRRLTPIETERLQGFPDAHTLVEYRGKTAADGPRYKAIGNSMAVPVMAWIGKRIKEVNDRMRYT
jgi:DNA (cytosine-5)-methyltransferase 1